MPARQLLLECSHGFGDGLYNVPLTEAFAHKYGPVGIAVRAHCQDAWFNVPWVDEILTIPGMHGGVEAARTHGYQQYFQLTQNVHFFDFKSGDPNHSLVNTPRGVAQLHGLELPDRRPQIFLTAEELATRSLYHDGIRSVAIEAVFKSGQSWADAACFQKIVDRFANTHRILWLSPEVPAPAFPRTAVGLDDMKRWTRRQCIAALSTADVFFSVGSGFFCASLALPQELRPPRSVCLWRDELYKEEDPINQEGWLPNLTWVHDHAELDAALA
jgi:hypothetical protein